MMMLLLAFALSLMIGVVLGMLGGGGAILMLPMLVYAIGVDPRTAIAMSLFVIGATSLFGLGMHARTGAVRWKPGAMFGAAAMVGAFAGGRLAHFVPTTVLLILFALVMVTSAIAMMRQKTTLPHAAARPARMGRMLGLGAAVGLLSGLVGAGGGFLIVPSLVLLGGLSMRESVATSLFVIAMQSLAGFAGHVNHVSLDWTLALGITAAAGAGSLLGARVGRLVSPSRLRRAFAWLVVAMALFTFAKQLPLLLALAASGLTVLAVVFTLRKGPSRPAAPNGRATKNFRSLPSQPSNPDAHPSSR
jgi:uncharacterized membrane protein YfcA